MTRLRSSLLLILFFAGFATPRARADDISKIPPAGYVIDQAGVIPADTLQRLTALSTELQQKTGAQLAIVTVKSLDDRPVDDVAVDIFKHLGVGGKADNNGVLLLLAPNDRKYRIEVGYGLEPIINDARAGDAGRAMVPFLRQNNFGAAIETAAWQVAKYIADDKGVTLSLNPPARAVAEPARGGKQLNPGPVIVFLLIAASFIFQFFRSNRRAMAGSRGSGCVNGCLIPLFLSGGGFSGGSSWGGGGFGGGGGGGGGGFGGFGGGSSGGGGASGSW